MDIHNLDNASIQRHLGQRLRARRLRENRTQEALAEHSGVSLNTVRNAEEGRNVSLDTFISLLRSLRALPELAALLQDSGPSPVALARRGGKQRQRASGEPASEQDGDWSW